MKVLHIWKFQHFFQLEMQLNCDIFCRRDKKMKHWLIKHTTIDLQEKMFYAKKTVINEDFGRSFQVGSHGQLRVWESRRIHILKSLWHLWTFTIRRNQIVNFFDVVPLQKRGFLIATLIEISSLWLSGKKFSKLIYVKKNDTILHLCSFSLLGYKTKLKIIVRRFRHS